MGKCLATIRGVPLRKIIERRYIPGTRMIEETLKCGHKLTHQGSNFDPYSKFRRCYQCKVDKAL